MQTNPLIAALQEMIKSCQNLRALMETDVSKYVKDDIAAINESNQQKAVLLDKLTSLMHEVDPSALITPHASNFIDTLKNKANELDDETKSQVNGLLNELKNEVTQCYQYLYSNGKIVMTNLAQMKKWWEKLVSLQTEYEFVYDQKGHTPK